MPLTHPGHEGAGDVAADPLAAPADTVWVVETGADDETARPVEDNSHAGQGSVVLDIGGEIGALVLHASRELEGVEIEIRPTGDTPYADGCPAGAEHPHIEGHEHPHGDHGHDHAEDHEHADDHQHGDGSVHDAGPVVGGVHRGHKLLHVAVLRRPAADGALYAAVYPSLAEGSYELYRRPADPVAMSVVVTGGQVTEAHWPDGL